MNGYVLFDEKIINEIITEYYRGDQTIDHYRAGVFNYTREIYDLNKPIYFTNNFVRGFAQFIYNLDLNAYTLYLDTGIAKASVLFTEDDHYVTTYQT